MKSDSPSEFAVNKARRWLAANFKAHLEQDPSLVESLAEGMEYVDEFAVIHCALKIIDDDVREGDTFSDWLCDVQRALDLRCIDDPEKVGCTDLFGTEAEEVKKVMDDRRELRTRLRGLLNATNTCRGMHMWRVAHKLLSDLNGRTSDCI